MLSADARVPRVDYLGLARNKAPKKLQLLIVYLLGILRTKKTLLL
jgi:hypothetical protein